MIPQKKKNFRSPLVHAAATRLEAGRIFHAGLRKLWLRRADLLRASGTAARLVRRRSRGYAVRRWALRTTGVRRSVRIDLLIDNNTLPTWAGASRALARLALSHLVTYPLKLTLRSSQLASPQGPSLNRLLAWRAWLLGVSGGLRVEDALEADSSFALRLGTGPGTAFARPADGALALLASLLASPCLPVWIVWGPH